jgi:hypothetical protein
MKVIFVLIFSMFFQAFSLESQNCPIIQVLKNDFDTSTILCRVQLELKSQFLNYEVSRFDATSVEYEIPKLRSVTQSNLFDSIMSIKTIGLMLKEDTLTDRRLFIETWMFRNSIQAAKVIQSLKEMDITSPDLDFNGNLLWLYCGDNYVYSIRSYEYSFRDTAMKSAMYQLYHYLPDIVDRYRIRKFEF